ncbi:hypothetical protein LKL48_15920, partial [Listeria monocytogenes]
DVYKRQSQHLPQSQNIFLIYPRMNLPLLANSPAEKPDWDDSFKENRRKRKGERERRKKERGRS